MGVRAPRTRASQRHSRDIRHNSYPQPRSWRARGSSGTGHRTWGSFADIHGDGKTKRLPMLLPLIIHILPYRPHPTDPCLCSPASTCSPPPLVIIPLRSVIVLPTSSISIVGTKLGFYRYETNDWKWFKDAWDQNRANAHGPEWGLIFAETMQGVLKGTPPRSRSPK